MSAENEKDQELHQEFAKQFTKEVEVAMHALAAKYKGQINDLAVVVNWTPENHRKPYPKLVIETMRDMADKSAFSPVQQAMEISDLLNMAGIHVTRQLLFHTMQQNHEMAGELAKHNITPQG